METNKLEWEDYGWANGWSETPERVKLAGEDPEAKYTEHNIGRCMTEYVCEKYKFRYKVDSSD